MGKKFYGMRFEERGRGGECKRREIERRKMRERGMIGGGVRNKGIREEIREKG